jgi:hypothetical protein
MQITQPNKNLEHRALLTKLHHILSNNHVNLNRVTAIIVGRARPGQQSMMKRSAAKG